MAKSACESPPEIPDSDESPTNCCFHLPRWWSASFRKLREWSEMVAGPKWKTFIRRLNRSKAAACAGVGGGGHNKAASFQYDPLSYALNFDEGASRICVADQDHGYYPDFASRYVSPGPLKTPMDFVTPVAAAAG